MPKKASKEQLLDWKKRLESSKVVLAVVDDLIQRVDEEQADIKAEMKEYGMLEEDNED